MQLTFTRELRSLGPQEPYAFVVTVRTDLSDRERQMALFYVQAPIHTRLSDLSAMLAQPFRQEFLSRAEAEAFVSRITDAWRDTWSFIHELQTFSETRSIAINPDALGELTWPV